MGPKLAPSFKAGWLFSLFENSYGYQVSTRFCFDFHVLSYGWSVDFSSFVNFVLREILNFYYSLPRLTAPLPGFESLPAANPFICTVTTKRNEKPAQAPARLDSAAQTVPVRTVATFTPVRWDPSVFGPNALGEVSLMKQYDYFYKHERVVSEMAAVKSENRRLIEEICGLKRAMGVLRDENFRLKTAEQLPSAFSGMALGSAFSEKGVNVFSSWIAARSVIKSVEPVEPEQPAEPVENLDDEDEKLMAEITEYLNK